MGSNRLAPRKWGRGEWVVALAAAFAVFEVFILDHQPPNVLASALIQAVGFLLALYGAYVLGQADAEAAAQKLIRPHAASAFRRMQNLYAGLGRLKERIKALRQELASEGVAAGSAESTRALWGLEMLDAVVDGQIATGDDALNDWRDLAPDEVKRVEDEAKARREDGQGATP